MSRWRSFLPDLMTVRAVMVRAALEEKKNQYHNAKAVTTLFFLSHSRSSGEALSVI